MSPIRGIDKYCTIHIPSHLAEGADPDEVPVLHPGDEDADEADEGELHEGEEDHHEADHHEDVQSCSPHSINKQQNFQSIIQPPVFPHCQLANKSNRNLIMLSWKNVVFLHFSISSLVKVHTK